MLYHFKSRRKQLLIFIAIITVGTIIWETTYLNTSTTQTEKVNKIAVITALKQKKFKLRQRLIPLIIHQRWDSTMIPTIFEPWVKSWIETHPPPKWRYYFWTEAGEKALIKQHFPEFETKYTQFQFPVSRADGARVLMLERYGGVYADLDTEVKRPMDDLVTTHSCFTASNQPLHHHWLKGLIVSNAVLGCKAKEPFLKLVRQVIMNSSSSSNVADIAGSFCWQKAVEIYRKAGNSNVTVTEPHVFIPTVDMDQKKTILQGVCRNATYLATLCPLRQKDCQRLLDRDFTNFEAGPLTRTDHHWVHSFWHAIELNMGKLVNITSLVPHAIVDPPLQGL